MFEKKSDVDPKKREAVKLMAEYMGAKAEIWYPSEEPSYTFVFERPFPHGVSSIHESSAKYTTSWDWIMLVLERIREEGYICILHGKYCAIAKSRKSIDKDAIKFESSEARREPLMNSDGIRMYIWNPDTLMEAAILTIVKFLKWRNEQSVSTDA